MRNVLTTILFVFVSLISAGQSGQQYQPEITWKTYVENVVYLDVDSFRVDVAPIDYNDPGAGVYGNYLIDNVGHIFTVTDTTATTVTVIDEFGHGIAPVTGQLGYIYTSVGDGRAPFISPIVWEFLDEKAKDNADLIFKDILWRQAELYGLDSAQIQFHSDTLIWDATKTDLLTLKDSLPKFATLQEALIGTDSFKIISPLINAQVDSLNNVPYKGALENIYTDYSISADSLFSNWGLIDSIVSEYYKATGTVIINEFSDDHTLSGNSDSVLVTERAIKQFVQNAIQGGVVYLGSWNASTNTPAIADLTGNLGDMYAVSVTGTQDLGSGSVTYTAGGFVIHNGTIWEYIGTDAMVASINTYTGAVELWPVLTGDKLTIRGNTTGINIGDATSVSGNTSAITTINNTLNTHNTRIIALEGLDIIEFSDTTIIATRYDIDTLSTGVYSEITDLNDSIDIHRILIDANSGKDTTGIYHHNRAILDAINDTWNDFTEWDKDYFDLINRPNFQDSIATYQTDNQQLSIDSLNRVFTITLEDGGSVKFLDTNTQYDLDSLVSGIRDSVDYLYIWDKSQSDSLIHLYSWNTNQSDSINVNRDSIESYNDRILTLEAFEETDPLFNLWFNDVSFQDSVLFYETHPEFATLQEALIGIDNTKIISPLTNRQVDSLINVPYSGALENIYSDYNITVDTLISTSLQGTSIRAVAVDEDGRLIDTTFVFDDIELLRDSVIDNINRIYELSDSVIYLYGWSIIQSDSIENNYIWDFQQSDSIQFLYDWFNNVNFQDSVLTYQIFQDLTGIRDTLQFHSDSLAIAFDSISQHNSRLIELEGLDTTGIFHHNRQFLDSLSYATLQDVLIGVDTSKIITPFIAAQRDSLLNVPYSGAIENIYTDYNFTADSIFANYFNIDFDSLQITVSQISDLPIQVTNETPTGTINGTNDTFSTAYNFKSETTEVFLNGVLQILSVNYTEGSGQIIFNAGFEPYTGDYLIINYIR